jgi:hypothetical protein
MIASGCDGEPATNRPAPVKVATDFVPDEPPPQTEPPLEDEAIAADASDSRELKLADSGMTFVVPANWKQIKPETNIIEAEFELPRADGDDYDGRLTLMSALGDRQEMIGKRISEFKFDPGESTSQEIMTIGGVEATIVDLRGTWSGPDFRPIKPPREGYRMLYVVVPFGEQSSFFAKLTGPRSTIAAHEDVFREFLKSAKITR